MALTEVPDVPTMDLRTALGDHLEYVERESLDLVSLTADQLLLPAERFTSDEFFVVGHYPGHIIASTRFDLVEVCAERDSFRLLGLAILGAVFANAEVTIELRPPSILGGLGNGQLVRELQIDGRSEDVGIGIVFQPRGFHYAESSPGDDLHPLYVQGVTESEMPTMVWRNDRDETWLPERFENRDLVSISGPASGLGRMVVALLDIGSPRASLRRFELEGASGFQSLSSASCWTRLWVGFDYDEP